MTERAHSAALRKSIDDILGACRLMSVGTVGTDGGPWLHNAYFCHDPEFRLYFLSSPEAQHSRNLAAGDGRVAVTVAETAQPGTPGTRRGVQLQGHCAPAAGDELPRGAGLFAAAFPAFAGAAAAAAAAQADGRMPARALYVVKPGRFRLFDELTFGQETWLDGGFPLVAASSNVV
ncbi:pyridoxamine 5'-phosphate oxidase family protein [Streptacidiphilus monticola]|uniref:Pyridoxamine 5'-phosphate oxidase family protein n=1 Tax=Streptacidiphilus monticola TaxID=2161674 RepID=A0ABW1G8W2_9ACTN